MTESTEDINPVDILAVEFVEALRCGYGQNIEAWAERHPELADDIRALFPTIASLERARAGRESDSDSQRASLGAARLERLGDLRIIREIGRGGMGIVYEAEQESLQRRVAVKVLPKQALLDKQHLLRFRRESRTAAQLHHTNIVPILGIGEHDGFHYYVMQKITGTSLDRILPLIGRSAGQKQIDESSDSQSSNSGEWAMARAMLQGRFAATTDDESAVDQNLAVQSSATIVVPQTGTDDPSSLSLLVTGDFAKQHEEETDSGSQSSATEIKVQQLTGEYWRSVARIGHQAASALDYAHQQGTMHRDIKPANLILDLHGIVWIADFGLAKAMEQDDVSRTGDIVGTLKYMAPEQLHGQSDARSDVFSLGMTLYELLALRPAWSETERRSVLLSQSSAVSPPMLRSINPSIPRDLETIVQKAIANEPHDRFQSADEMALDLQRHLEGRPILARRSTYRERLWRWSQRNPALAAISCIAMLLLCTVAAVSTIGYQQTSSALQEEANQRLAAESNASMALKALDSMFARFTPTGQPMAFVDTGETVDTSTPALLSNEAADLLRELAMYYQYVHDPEGEDADKRRLAKANLRLGDIDHRLGRYDQAQNAYRKALAIYRELAESNASGEFDLRIARLHLELGNTFLQQRDSEQAQQEYAQAEELLLVMKDQDDAALALGELARLYYLQIKNTDGRRRGGILSRLLRNKGRKPADRQKLEDAIQIMEDLTECDEPAPEHLHLLGILYLEARLYYCSEDRSIENEYHELAIETLEAVTDDWPDNPEFRFALSGALASGDPRDFRRSDQYFDDFAERLTRSIKEIDLLVEEHPQIPKYREFEAGTHHKMGTVLMRLGFPREAKRYYAAAVEYYQVLAERHPEQGTHYLVRGALVRQSLGGLLMKSDDLKSLEQALDEFRLAIETMEAASLEDDDADAVQHRLRRTRKQLAECEKKLERLRTAPAE